MILIFGGEETLGEKGKKEKKKMILLLGVMEKKKTKKMKIKNDTFP